MLAVNAPWASAASSSPKWSPPLFIGAPGSSSTSTGYDLSCPTGTFCVAVNGFGQVIVRRHGVWSPPHVLALGGSIDAVSCSSASSCVAIGDGNATQFNGRRWSKAVPVGPAGDTYQISCPTPTFCAAVGANGHAGQKSALLSFDGQSWTTYATTSSTNLKSRLMDVSCATARFCTAVNFDGQVLNFNGVKWTSNRVTGPPGLMSVSCPAIRFCIDVSISGQSKVFQSGKWSTPTGRFSALGLYSVSCATMTWCSAIGLNGEAVNWENGRWSSPLRVFGGSYQAGVAISCPAVDRCVALDDRGKSANQ